MLELDLVRRSDVFETLHHLGVIRSAVREGRSLAQFNVAVLRLVHRRIIRGVGNIDDERDVGMQRVGNLSRAEAADLLLDV